MMEATIEIKKLECTECGQYNDGHIEITEMGGGYIDDEMQIPFDCLKCGHKQYITIKIEVEYN